jgi:VIT1/CCC1 family predicted Fe2+/Mn2+ transporter
VDKRIAEWHAAPGLPGCGRRARGRRRDCLERLGDVGVAASGQPRTAIFIAGVAALVAGAGSMAAGEYVSVSSQRDTERAGLRIERRELAADPDGERREPAAIYERRGLKPELADQVAAALMRHDALRAHARDEPGFDLTALARPVQAALSSAASFMVGLVPIAALLLAPAQLRTIAVVVTALLSLFALGVAGAVPAGRRRSGRRSGSGSTAAWAMAITAGWGGSSAPGASEPGLAGAGQRLARRPSATAAAAPARAVTPSARGTRRIDVPDHGSRPWARSSNIPWAPRSSPASFGSKAFGP